MKSPELLGAYAHQYSDKEMRQNKHEGSGLRTEPKASTLRDAMGIHSVLSPKSSVLNRNMKAARQVEAVELMVASNTITVAHVDPLGDSV